MSTVEVSEVRLLGDSPVSFIGFGGPDLQPAPPVGFNLTFSCPAGQVFNHDWFATPFVMMTCQVSLHCGPKLDANAERNLFVPLPELMVDG